LGFLGGGTARSFGVAVEAATLSAALTAARAVRCPPP
jgi:hypothetical protein